MARRNRPIASRRPVKKLLGRSTDAGHLGRDLASLAAPVALALLLQMAVLRSRSANITAD